MKKLLLGITGSMLLAGAAIAQTDAAAPAPPADAPPPAPPLVPQTRIDTTVVGDARDANAAPDNGTGLDNDHHFEAGAPHLTEMAKLLNLTAAQKTRLRDVIERGDAAAAVFIKREHNVKEMLSKTTPEDPLYAELRAEQDGAEARWQAGRDTLHEEVRAILTPAQQSKLQQLRDEHRAEFGQL